MILVGGYPRQPAESDDEPAAVYPDLADVRGQERARRALELAAALWNGLGDAERAKAIEGSIPRSS